MSLRPITRNARLANRSEELQRYGPEEKEDDIDVSDRSGMILKDMLDQGFEGLPPPYTELEEDRNIADDMTFMPLEPERRMEETVNDTVLDAIASPKVECQYWQAADREPLNQRTPVICFLLVTAVIRSLLTTSSGHWIFMACSYVLGWRGQTERNILSIGLVTASQKPGRLYTCKIWPMERSRATSKPSSGSSGKKESMLRNKRPSYGRLSFSYTTGMISSYTTGGLCSENTT